MGRKKFRPLDCAVSVTFSLSIVTVNLLPKTFGRQYHNGVKFFHKKNPLFYSLPPRTTDAQTGNSLHCMAENSLPLPNF